MTGGTYISYAGKKQAPDQAERRKSMTVMDQHGRVYHLIYDTSARTTIMVMPQFHAPWLPDLKVLNESIKVNDADQPTGVFLDYDALIAKNRLSWSRWFEILLSIGSKMPGVDGMKAYDAAVNGRWDEVPRSLLNETGQTPDPEDFPKAAKAGNRWILGLSNEVPSWAEPLIALREVFRSRAEMAVTDDELDKYRDVEEEADPEAVNGHTEPMAPKKGRRMRSTEV